MSVSVCLSASTFLRSASGIFAKASLVGAKTVMSCAEFSVSTRPACLTADTRVDSCGLPEAAVATGTCAMAWKLALFAGSVGTAAQPGPKGAIAAVANMLGAGVAVVVAGAAALAVSLFESLPHAASEIEKTAAAASAVSLGARMVHSSIFGIYTLDSGRTMQRIGTISDHFEVGHHRQSGLGGTTVGLDRDAHVGDAGHAVDDSHGRGLALGQHAGIGRILAGPDGPQLVHPSVAG